MDDDTNVCRWTWLGDEWFKDVDCRDGKACNPPAGPGAFIGQPAMTPCS